MKTVVYSLLISAVMTFPAQAAPYEVLEDFESGKADWLDVDYLDAGVTHHTDGGHDGGAYISVTDDIDTTVGGYQGGFTVMRCGQFNNQAPLQDCSGGVFVGNWYFDEGVQEVRLWYRHHSTKAGGLTPQVRFAPAFNSPGASGIPPAAIPANTWTELVFPIDLQDVAWDKQWGALVPDGVKIFRQINRIQPGYVIDPEGPDYAESAVKFDIDDVRILGSTPITAVVDTIQSGGQHGHGHKHWPAHLHHDGDPDVVDDLHDHVRVMVYGASTGVGDPADLNTDDIDQSSVRIGRLGGSNVIGKELYGLDHDTDGQDDAEFAGRIKPSFGDGQNSCQASWAYPTSVDFRAELSTGEVIAGKDSNYTKSCNAGCHIDP